ncbi:response regulator [Larkinella knui]|uniref:Response regulator n=1 Tax=Larkinella knui TaxID=2025310 RepID=A0A3P1CAE7_9BACT|nr:response regulator [Larkinella knui]RRB10277.1 response regulator [Larkinella knui]
MPRPIHCILLIDDDPDDNYLHQLVIEESGLCDAVRSAETGLQALTYLTETHDSNYVRPDVILLDINMPGMNGFEFLERYCQLDEVLRSRLVLLMLTTSLNPVDKNRAGQFEDVKGYLTKPVTKEMLQEIIDQYFPASV